MTTQLDPRIRLRALRSASPSKLSGEQHEELATLEIQVEQGAITSYREVVTPMIAAEWPSIAAEWPDYEGQRKIVDDLQVDLTAQAQVEYIDPTTGQQLLIRASGHRVAVSTIHRQARRHADRLGQLLDRLTRLWAHHSPAEVEWRSKAMVADILDPFRACTAEAESHADYVENAFWSLQKTCAEVEALVLMYDTAARLGPPVGLPQNVPQGGHTDANAEVQ